MITFHLSNDYAGSKVHYNLCAELSRQGCSPFMFTAIRHNFQRTLNMPPPPGVVVSHIEYNNTMVKFFPLFKVYYLFKKMAPVIGNALKENANSNPSILLAHTLWSDGMIAYQINRAFGLPFILVVRNTDMNVFLPRLIHYHRLIGSMIQNSQALIFISEAHHRRLKKCYPRLYNRAKIAQTIPNGVDDYWFENKITISHRRKSAVCFVGSFTPGKNLRRLVEALQLVHNQIPDLKAFFVGGTDKEFLNVAGLSMVPKFVEVVPRINEKMELKQIYQRCRVLCMPSLRETFGLVYVEGLSQGCAVVCSRGEGFHGAVDNNYVVAAVDPYNVNDIANAIIKLLLSYENGINPDTVIKLIQKFKWSNIAQQYLQLIDKSL